MLGSEAKNGHGRESGGCVQLGFFKENCSVQLSDGAELRGSRCLAGAIVLDPLKVLLYDDLVSVVISRVTKMAATPLDRPWPKPPVVRKLHGSVFYTSEVIDLCE